MEDDWVFLSSEVKIIKRRGGCSGECEGVCVWRCVCEGVCVEVCVCGGVHIVSTPIADHVMEHTYHGWP